MSNGKEINITSHNQSGGITAHTVNVGSSPRILTQENGRKIVENLLPYKEKTICVTSYSGDGESFNYANQILKLLVDNSFKTSGVDQVIWANPIPPLSFDNIKVQVNVGSRF